MPRTFKVNGRRELHYIQDFEDNINQAGILDIASALSKRHPGLGHRDRVAGTSGVVPHLMDRDARNALPRTRDAQRSVICFTLGTTIATSRGKRVVEGLGPGDKVITRDNGYKTLRWVGRQELSEADLVSCEAMRPVVIRQDAISEGMPGKDVIVSPDHRILINSKAALLIFGEKEVLVAAKDLLRLPGVERTAPKDVTYVHLLFDQHEVILTDTIWTESFQPSRSSLNGLREVSRKEVYGLFPDLSTPYGLDAYRPVRRSLESHEALMFVR